jgi:hypothetical protein
MELSGATLWLHPVGLALLGLLMAHLARPEGTLADFLKASFPLVLPPAFLLAALGLQGPAPGTEGAEPVELTVSLITLLVGWAFALLFIRDGFRSNSGAMRAMAALYGVIAVVFFFMKVMPLLLL